MKAQPVKNCERIDNIRSLKRKKEGRKMRRRKVREDRLVKTREELAGIRESGKVNKAVLDAVAEKIGVGMSTEEIDEIVYKTTIELRGTPAPLHYEGFPKSVCTSVNNQICHGIPSRDVILNSGDIINVDVSTIYKGYFSDSSRMFLIGEVSEENRRLVQVAKECVEEGLKMVGPFRSMGSMGAAIHDYAKANGYSVVREIGGHGIGLKFHEDPFVSYVTMPDTGIHMPPGMVFTIEPMINAGTCKFRIDKKNGWEITTADGKMSAQWEVTVAVTEDGYEILAD